MGTCISAKVTTFIFKASVLPGTMALMHIHTTEHNLFITLLVRSKAKTVLAKQK